MKTDNQVKALFMRQFLGQRVVSPSFETDENFMLSGITLDAITINVKGELFTINEHSLIIKGDFSDGTAGFDQVGQCDIENATLLLRDISQIQDSEAIELAKIFGYETDFFNGTDQLRYGRNISEGILMPDFSGWSTIIIMAIDWLRSIGILIPFTYIQDGKPTTLSPAELIELGWVKIKEV